MKKDNLHEFIKRYEENINLIYGDVHDELFKWRAMKVWRDEWFKPDTAFVSFADRLNAARKEFSLFIDNSRMHPSTGVIKLWEKEPETVERLFCEVLFADAHGDVSEVQNNMDKFLDEYENLRSKYFPSNWSFKQDRHSASVFLAMNDPDFNYVYKSSEAQTMAKYVDFGLSIGSGSSFSLPNYYRLCDEIVEALREHDSLLKTHFSRLTSDHYNDQSLHLLAFDLMYCCRTYNFYNVVTLPAAVKAKRKRVVAESVSPEEAKRQEEERLAKIADIEQEIYELERDCDNCSEISLIGVQVTAKPYGTGTVVAQDRNTIKVRFDGVYYHNSDFSLRKMQLISNSLCYGPDPEPNDEIEQRLTITSNGRVWLSRYRYGMGTDVHELYEKNSFSISLESAKRILRVVSDYFGKEYEPYYVTDVGYWNLLLTDTNGQIHKIFGSLSYNSELGLGGLSEFIRSELRINDLLIFDGKG